MIQRNFDTFELKKGKVTVLYGPRRVGKTTSLKKIQQETEGKVFFESGEDRVLRNVLDTMSSSEYRLLFDEYDVIIIDEAQIIPEIGKKLKFLVDIFKDKIIIASGSSSFELASEVGEPLVGRYVRYTMYPVSTQEYATQYSRYEFHQQLNSFLLYGLYPEVVMLHSENEKKEYLNTLVESYLYKDILAFENIRNADKLSDLLRLIAYQIGNEISLNELGNTLDISKHTVSRYLDLLEKTFVIKKVRGFSRNLRKEVSKSNRYYFYDNGVLNAVMNNFNKIELREDVGRLWENFLFIERIKKQEYSRLFTKNYFWRTYEQKEIDLVEEVDGALCGYEFKWGKKTATAPNDWVESYPNASFQVINQDNYLDFIL